MTDKAHDKEHYEHIDKLLCTVNEHWEKYHNEEKSYHYDITKLALDYPEYEYLCDAKAEVLKAYVTDILNYISNNGSYSNVAGVPVINMLLSSNFNLNYSEEELIKLLCALNDKKEHLRNCGCYVSPIFSGVSQLEQYIKKNGLSDSLFDFIASMLDWELFQLDYSYSKEHKKTIKRLHSFVAQKVVLQFKLDNHLINEIIVASPLAKQREFHDLLFLLEKSTAGKPSAKFLKTSQAYIDTLGRNNYRKFAHNILDLTVKEYWTEFNFLKGVVWTMSLFSDKKTVELVAQLLTFMYDKGHASLGNACAYTLGNIRGKQGLGKLSYIRGKLTRNKDKAVVEKYLDEGAERYGVSVEELKELAVPDFHLENGQKTIAFEDYQLTIAIENSKVTQTWTKPDGKTVKTVPAIVKNSTKLTNKLKEIRKEIKEIQQTYSAQKQRIDNQFTLNRKWTFADFEQYYLTHGLVAPIAKSLIWQFHQAGGNIVTALFNREANAWQDQHGETVSVAEAQSVSLWHPVLVNEEEIIAWRDRIMAIECQQPIKQAFREIYLLTDAEISTRTYSNRMATHILKQSQFKVLATLRDWHYASMGAYYDYTTHTTCSKKLSEHNMSAEFWIDAVESDDEDDRNASGMYWYVTTDQVRFNNADGETMDLVDVPKIVFSEIMRDVDLFVGVCSVGNDPEWRDNNGERRDEYWQSYSFGDLGKVAKTRKAVLERLLPRLTKLKDKAHIDGKFLVVKGALRTYKIHIGSSNILMEPNDQYLCIVPARNSDKATDKLFIPFEGDNGLSIVLSKAFMLAEDTKIKDETITSQINRES
ncbi:MAG: hypothetical protein CR974_02090 [Gammaproteobacteria bacterium]|nr:MAG: hypothetical protein CR974_02090 [Gammaproteobacteria bacterium]